MLLFLIILIMAGAIGCFITLQIRNAQNPQETLSAESDENAGDPEKENAAEQADTETGDAEASDSSKEQEERDAAAKKAAEQAAAQYYTIRQGDNLGKIAGKYHTTVSRLCKLNNITPKTILRVGRRIRVN